MSIKKINNEKWLVDIKDSAGRTHRYIVFGSKRWAKLTELKCKSNSEGEEAYGSTKLK